MSGINEFRGHERRRMKRFHILVQIRRSPAA
jgi:hypothetical protein